MNLSNGSRGQSVQQLQQLLNFLGQRPNVPGSVSGTALPLLVTDGIFGAKTRARVIEFQTRARVKADGIVGPITGAALAGSVVARVVKPSLV